MVTQSPGGNPSWPLTSHSYHSLQGPPCPGPSLDLRRHSATPSLLVLLQACQPPPCSLNMPSSNGPRVSASAWNTLSLSPAHSFSPSGLSSNGTLSETSFLTTPYKIPPPYFFYPLQVFFFRTLLIISHLPCLFIISFPP